MRAQEVMDIESLLGDNDILESEANYDDIVQVLSALFVSPLNINTADFDSLKMIVFLSDTQIDNLLSFRKKYGGFAHVNELLLVDGIGERDFNNIKPFICVGVFVADESLSLSTSFIHHELLARIRSSFPLQEGYQKYSREDFPSEYRYQQKVDNRFHGPPVASLLKYKFNMGKLLQAGVTLENDAGEGYFNRHQRTGFDFLSAHASIVPNRFVQRVVVGDYYIQWGQGLVAWGGFSSGKSSVAIGNEKAGRGLLPYTSVAESNFLRGIGVTLHPLKGVVADLFFSCKKTDGTIDSRDSLEGEDVQTASLYETGLHRNNNECRKKNTLRETVAGVSVRVNRAYFRVGVNALYYNYKPELERGTQPYRRYNDTGRDRLLVSLDYRTGFQNIYFFGEAAVSEVGAIATVNGLRFSGSKAALSLIYRRYDKRYVSHFAGGFGEYSNTSNEEGLYWGMEVNPVRNLKISAYYDWYRFFSSRFRAFVPASGKEFVGMMTYSGNRFVHSFRYKYDGKPMDWKGTVLLSVPKVKNDYRYQVNLKVNSQIELRTRLNWVTWKQAVNKGHGWLVYEDFVYSPPLTGLRAQLRLAFFDVDSYDARIYCYEHNVLYGYSFPAFSDKGLRSYINLSWKASEIVTLYLKTGCTYYPDKDYLSSGVSRVDGHKVFDLSLQMRVKL